MLLVKFFKVGEIKNSSPCLLMCGAIMAFVYIVDESAYVRLSGSQYLITQNDEVKLAIPAAKLEGLVLFDRVQITSQALIAMLRQGVFVTWLSGTGDYVGRLESPHFVNVSKQKRQIMLSDNINFNLHLAKKIVFAKMYNSGAVLYRYNRERNIPLVVKNYNIIKAMRNKLATETDIAKVRGYEGYVAKLYFEALGQLVPLTFAFKGRSKKPPRDPFNSMLSLGYTLLQYELQTIIVQQGLHPYFPFYHVARSDYPALAYDLIEEWRAPLIDALVLSMIVKKEIVATDFDKPCKNGAVFLSYEGRKKFIAAYDKKMLTMNKYAGSNYSYRHTLNWQVSNLVKCLEIGSAEEYQAILIR